MNPLSELFRHNAMMNDRLIESCRALTPAQIAATVEGTYGSIGATLVHIANAQASYAARLADRGRPEPLPEDPFPGFDALAARMTGGNVDLQTAADGSDFDRTVVVTGDDPPGRWSMRVGLFLVQAINHSTEHRSQMATILTQIGVEPPAMDGWAFFELSGQMPDA